MNHPGLWADRFGAAALTAIADPEVLLAGRADLDDRGIENLLISPGRVFGLVPARNTGAELHTAITLPILTPDQAAALRAATPQPDSKGTDDPLPECPADSGHTGGVTIVPDPAELSFTCTCPATTPCRHTAALAHALVDRIRTHPEDLATLRGLRHPPHPVEPLPTAHTGPGTRPKALLSAHHVWAWYRERSDLPLVPTCLPSLSSEPPGPPAWSPPPPPAPAAEHLHALVNDAAAQARDFLRSGTPIECAWANDAVRLTSRIPRPAIADIADRLGLDIADLRSRITTTTSA
ncbi:hypothetical protein [Streptomyces clavuligerus]|uniref:hypothetical protein n=1 Tax=Streptomyces clavuligerus TaxID=1901 RepID=UPI00017FF8FE|nr:hypothetical protein [Streptomyces clavuligerus]AXU16863.1 hypothetical protein D1794_29315 [Streptomyces clavuligerus]EDY48710.1 hypothetical protein SSCG_01738 [Streptomyces clavuligerus]MBY6300998.1 hypothetical protein [Streptomyces clavuligerus]QPJ96994.1 hypothetical protein GE265_28165 [Streptomyces clavuligerus]WDN55806.1 hypothetical protein LL058_28340 [Streptomyces clavuligerus]